MKFESGNFNEFEKLIKEKLVEATNSIKTELVPKVEDTIKGMLDNTSNYKGVKANASIITDKGKISIKAELTYFIGDFKVQNIPVESIRKDEETIKSYLEADDVTIDTGNGMMTITKTYRTEGFEESKSLN